MWQRICLCLVLASCALDPEPEPQLADVSSTSTAGCTMEVYLREIEVWNFPSAWSEGYELEISGSVTVDGTTVDFAPNGDIPMSHRDPVFLEQLVTTITVPSPGWSALDVSAFVRDDDNWFEGSEDDVGSYRGYRRVQCGLFDSWQETVHLCTEGWGPEPTCMEARAVLTFVARPPQGEPWQLNPNPVESGTELAGGPPLNNFLGFMRNLEDHECVVRVRMTTFEHGNDNGENTFEGDSMEYFVETELGGQHMRWPDHGTVSMPHRTELHPQRTVGFYVVAGSHVQTLRATVFQDDGITGTGQDTIERDILLRCDGPTVYSEQFFLDEEDRNRRGSVTQCRTIGCAFAQSADEARITWTIEPWAEYARDRDGDYFSAAEDCDDRDPERYPYGIEWCDGIDNDCDGQADEGYRDGDGDTIPDCVDDDRDNDLIKNADDNCPHDGNNAQTDDDQDGQGTACDDCPHDKDNDADRDRICGDVDNCPAAWNHGQSDIDFDGLGNACDPDIDEDHILNEDDLCPELATTTSEIDSEGDGVGDSCDNCDQEHNPDQTNTDTDALGNACDPDDDNDGVPDNSDNCPWVHNPAQEYPCRTDARIRMLKGVFLRDHRIEEIARRIQLLLDPKLPGVEPLPNPILLEEGLLRMEGDRFVVNFDRVSSFLAEQFPLGIGPIDRPIPGDK